MVLRTLRNAIQRQDLTRTRPLTERLMRRMASHSGKAESTERINEVDAREVWFERYWKKHQEQFPRIGGTNKQREEARAAFYAGVACARGDQ